MNLLVLSGRVAAAALVLLQVRAVKQITVEDAPNVLTIHLKRFEYGVFGSKISKRIEFGLTLDLAPYMSDTNSSPQVCSIGRC